MEVTSVEAPQTAILQASCGYCDGKLLLVEGGKKTVCEACGHALARDGAFGCPTCGAHLLLAPARRSQTRAWCHTSLAAVG